MTTVTARGFTTIAATAVALAALIFTSAAASAATPAITASQVANLAPAGQMITVKGTGFGPNTALFLALCNPAVPAGGACDLSNFKQFSADASGGFSIEIKVTAKFGSTDCTKVACALATNEPANPRSTANVAVLPIAFTGAVTTTGSPAATATATTPSPSPTASAVVSAEETGSWPQWLVAVLVLLGVVLIVGIVLVLRRKAKA